MSENNFAENKVGALWKRKSKAGKTFLSGNIDVEKLAQLGVNDETVNITVISGKKREGKKDPDFTVLYSKPFVPSKKVAKKTVREDDEDVSFD